MKPLNILLVEDEPGAAANLKSLLSNVVPDFRLLAILPSVEEAVEWLRGKGNDPDLGFFDIQLEDGLSFEIFTKTTVGFPVIFTTAFDQYAIEAFKVNSIDYLLKPINEKQLAFSIRKFEQLRKPTLNETLIQELMQKSKHSIPRTFLVHFRDKLIPLPSGEVAFFFIENTVVHARTFKNLSYPLDLRLDELQDELDPGTFFRANRQFLVNRKAIRSAEYYFNGRLSLQVEPESIELILISKARVTEFRQWFENR
ncbi:LytTR family DNA-binding domain-containing protein [Algoriphagus sp. AGSA1]|uniref:LytR/AlgR family response regulator transcription factor n=1 Tax=Algoriphagus sp. AGSA1 TaxID=2907213 RepID=UPI001F448140|nr:LytTR family DNA-binding domain-containing protein [Algoriphagus sp. AGSA1]MCE7053864.1 LytTR family DNA-binding domain-containing protein [Algoriphagus sp. AGSA1]